MPTIWALSDLHLSTTGAKPMDKFGDHWEQHDRVMAERWDALVGADDIVLTPGDFSWAGKPAEALGDLAWLAKRPGTKILVKGNHDHWWPGTASKLAQLLPPRVHALKKTACSVQGVGFFGARGGDFAPNTRYGDQRTQAEVDQWLDREQAELIASLAALDALDQASGRPRGLRICLFHYPPIPPNGQASRFTPIIAAGGASWCIYGHLHGAEVGAARIEGRIGGIEYRCTSCDLLGFTPLKIQEIPAPAPP
jgi:predicted phosphohydrolase